MSGDGGRPGLVRLADGVLFQRAADEAVLLDTARGTYFALNEVAARMVEVARERPTADETVAVLASEYETTEAVLRDDLARLLAELRDHGLLAPDEATGAP